jgi:hypothetical protein
MSVQDALRDALHQVDHYEPSPDLFWRVQRSIEEDHAHRRRIRLAIALVTGGVVAIAGYVAVFLEFVDGEPTMPWWSLELLTTAILIALVLVLGPLIRRFGKLYAGAVFAANPPTTQRFLALIDIAYYLIFAGFILLSSHFEPWPEWVRPGGFRVHVEFALERVGVLLVMMGVLHSLTIVTLPVIGLVFSSGRQRAEGDEPTGTS